MENVSLVFLSYVAFINLMKKELPPLDTWTWAEAYVVWYMFASIVPLCQEDDNEMHMAICISVLVAFIVFSTLFIAYKIYEIR